jgi:hypothetical protein
MKLAAMTHWKRPSNCAVTKSLFHLAGVWVDQGRVWRASYAPGMNAMNHSVITVSVQERIYLQRGQPWAEERLEPLQEASSELLTMHFCVQVYNNSEYVCTGGSHNRKTTSNFDKTFFLGDFVHIS